jgi:AcrR family transcriptional regulator
MPKVSPQHEQARRDQLLAAAAACFSRAGFAATSVPDIVAEAGLSVGSLYRYFSSKEDLFLAVVEQRVAVHNEAVFAELSADGPPLDRIRAALERLQRLLARQPPEEARLTLELWSRAHDVAPLRDWLVDARRRRLGAFQDALARAKQAGELQPAVKPLDAAVLLLGLADGLVVQRACSPFLTPRGDFLLEVDRLLAAWKPTRLC